MRDKMAGQLHMIIWCMVLVGVCLVSLSVSAAEKTVSGYCGVANAAESVEWNYKDGVLTITGEGRMRDYSIYAGGKMPWEDYQDEIENVVIAEGVTSVGAYAFYDCRYIQSVQLPQSLRTIGDDAFGYCMRLTRIELPEGLEEIGAGAFAYTSLVRLVVPGSVEEIREYAMNALLYDSNLNWQYLDGILNLDERHSIVTLSEGVKKIDYQAFHAGYYIQTMYLPATVEQVTEDTVGETIPWDMINAIYGKNDYIRQCVENGNGVYVDATQEYDIAESVCKTNLRQDTMNQPAIRLVYMHNGHEVKLNEGVDYSITYRLEGSRGTATITGLGCYTGTKEITYRQYQSLPGGCSLVSDNKQDRYVYTGQPIEPEVVVDDGTNILQKGIDYEVEYSNNVEIGTASLIVKGIGDYRGTIYKNFTIVGLDDADAGDKDSGGSTEPGTTEDTSHNTTETPDNGGLGQDKGQIGGDNEIAQNTAPVPMQNVTIEPIADVTYCGKAVIPDAVLHYQGNALVKDRDYRISYQNNVNAGTATAVVEGIGTYFGQAEIPFRILPYDVSGLSNILKGRDGTIYQAVYTGKAICPTTAFRLKVTDQVYLQPKEKQDYTYRYRNNKAIGEAAIIYTFRGNYTGTVTKRFRIVPDTPQLKKGSRSTKGCALRWQKVKGCSYYEIYRKDSKKGTYKRIAKVKGNCNYVDRKCKRNKTYYYRIAACSKKKAYRSAYSKAVKF